MFNVEKMGLRIRVFSLVMVSLLASKVMAQGVVREDVFFCEVGLTGGGGFVLGDVNGVLFKYMEPLGGVFLKYKFDGHYELRLQVDGGLLGVGSVDGVYRRGVYGGMQLLGEFNFFNYGVHRWEAYRSWVTPTVVAGLGMVVVNDRVTASVPMGVGVKMKLSNRVNVGAYWMVSKTFTDGADFVDNPIGLNRGLWNNRDWYSTAQVFVSINFFKICAPCRNGVKVKSRYDRSKR